MAELHQITGGINPKSPKQVAEFLYDNLKFDELSDYKGNPIRTPSGGRKTDEQTCLALKPRTEAQKAFIGCFARYSPLKKELETLEKEHGLPKDEIERLEKVLDKMTQDEVAVVDTLLGQKEKELLEV